MSLFPRTTSSFTSSFIFLCLAALSLSLLGCSPGTTTTAVIKTVEDPKPNPVPSGKTYQLQSAVLSFYSKDRTWNLKGEMCCTNSSVNATFNVKAFSDDGMTFILGGVKLSKADVITDLRKTDNTSLQTTTVTHMFSRETGQLGLIPEEGVMEIFVPEKAFPQDAKVGDAAINARSTTYVNSIAQASTIYSWKVAQEASRTLLCLESNAVKASDGSVVKRTRCHQLNEDSSLGGYMSLKDENSLNGTRVGGFNLATE
ncbi:MAG: hypothetical protein K2P84_13315 [Undibacterium sp.]|nr:hypothetical protein [Undibacterium sp.]